VSTIRGANILAAATGEAGSGRCSEPPKPLAGAAKWPPLFVLQHPFPTPVEESWDIHGPLTARGLRELARLSRLHCKIEGSS
jgi:hypothetical protein